MERQVEVSRLEPIGLTSVLRVRTWWFFVAFVAGAIYGGFFLYWVGRSEGYDRAIESSKQWDAEWKRDHPRSCP